MTCDIFVRRRILSGNPNIDVLWIDEVSQLDISLLTQIAKLQWLGVQFILSGDRFQLPPIGNVWRAGVIADDALYGSNFLWDLAGGKRLTLTECLRSDKELFNAFSVLPGMFGADGLQELLVQYRAKFPATSPAVHNLCISHAKRVAINKAENTRLAPREAVFIKVAGKQAAKCQAQSFYIWPGLRMLGCVSQKGIKNGVLYEVASIGGNFHNEGRRHCERVH